MINTIIFGSTGMVGEGVLHICLNDERVNKVLVINRKSCDIVHPKLEEIILTDFNDIESISDKLSNYNACYYCMGVSSVGMPLEKYKNITYNLTLKIGKLLRDINDDMTFCYVSGEGTDETEKNRAKWANIKGKTENDLAKLGFKSTYMFRPGYIHPIKGLKNTHKFYKFLVPIYPLLKILFNKHMCTLEELGNSMIYVTSNKTDNKILNNLYIKELGNKI
jgi:hypothetical protein